MTHPKRTAACAPLICAAALCAVGGCEGGGDEVMVDENGRLVRAPMGPIQRPPGTTMSSVELQALVLQVQSGQRRLEDLTPEERQLLYAAANPARRRR